MKIAIFVPFFPPKHLAGSEIATYNIAKHLAKKGQEVHILTTLDKGLPKESTKEDFYVHRIFRPRIRILGGLLFFINVFWCLKKIEPDIIHIQAFGIETPVVFLIKKLLKKPCVIWGQGSDVYVQWMFKEPISKIVLKRADAVIALTDDMKREMKKIYDRDIAVIPNGIDLDKFENISGEKIRAILHIKEEEKIIIYVGTLRPIKGLKYLIQAMKLIKDKNKNVRLMLVGDGVEREYLENLVKKFDLEENVNFVGKVPNEKVPEYMIASDIFTLSSLSEGLPIVVLEAMASGLPIVATRVGGIPDIVKDGEIGFLVDPKNPEKIAEKINLILEDDKLRGKISRNVKKKAKEHSWESVIEHLEKIYIGAINKKETIYREK